MDNGQLQLNDSFTNCSLRLSYCHSVAILHSVMSRLPHEIVPNAALI